MKELCSKPLQLRMFDGGFGESEGNRNAISTVTEVAELSTQVLWLSEDANHTLYTYIHTDYSNKL